MHTADTAPATAHRHRAAPAPHSDPEPDAGPRKSWAVLALALTAQILVVLDISVVNTALPAIGSRCAWAAATCSGWSPPTCCSPAAACCSAAASPTCCPDAGCSSPA